MATVERWIERLQQPVLSRLEQPGGWVTASKQKRTIGALLVTVQFAVVLLILMMISDSAVARWIAVAVWATATAFVVSLAISPVPAARVAVATLVWVFLGVLVAYAVFIVVVAWQIVG